MIPGITERLKLPLQTSKAISSLVKNHLLLVETALRRDLNDEELIVRMAQQIQDPSTLKMLYLLSYADALLTSTRAWNNWKSLLLKELFFNIFHILEKGEWDSGLALETIEASQRQVMGLLEKEISGKEVKDLLEGMPSSYLLSILPSRLPNTCDCCGSWMVSLFSGLWKKRRRSTKS